MRLVRAGQWPAFDGERWSTSAVAKQKYGTSWVRPKTGEGLQKDRVCTGGNSGYQAIGLAYLFGAARIVLLGYDMQRTGGKSHWHGDHPRPLGNGGMHHEWVKRFDRLQPKLAAAGLEVLNATRSTALNRFPRINLSVAIGE